MRKPQLLVPAIVLASFLVSGVLIATNMGFKFNRVLNGPGSSASGANAVGLPFHKQVGMVNAKHLIDDITAGGGAVAGITRFVNSSDSFDTYNGIGGAAFTLAKSEGVIVTMNTDAEYMVFGTHDPGHVVNFNGVGTSLSGLNFYSPPYHSTSINAEELLDEINDAGGSAIAIHRYDNSTDRLQTFDGVSGYNFSIEPTQAYFVQTATDFSFTPSHY